mgnify:CR=1 FL=1
MHKTTKEEDLRGDEPTFLANDIEVDMDTQAEQTHEYSKLVSGEPSEN